MKTICSFRGNTQSKIDLTVRKNYQYEMYMAVWPLVLLPAVYFISYGDRP